jgi:TolB-like protein
MLVNKLSLKTSIVAITLVILHFLFNLYGHAAEHKKVLILPFKIHSQENFAYLQEGIRDMLSSRLAHEDNVLFISEEKIQKAVKNQDRPQTEKSAIALGKTLAADYVVFGSLTALGDSISTDGRLVDIHKGKSVVNFSRLGTRSGDIIKHVDQFAAEIRAKALNITAAARTPSFTQAPAADTHQHPEKLILQSVKKDESTVKKAPAIQMEIGERWLSRNFKTEIRAIAVDDVDRDGQTEIVVMDLHSVKIFRFYEHRLIKLAELKEKSFNRFLNIGTADLNADGKPEIYISNTHKKNYSAPLSLVVEWDGKGLRKLAKREPWYFRVMDHSGQGKVLFGQKRGITMSAIDANNLFGSGVHELSWKGGKLEKGKSYELPNGVNIFDFSIGDLFNNGKKMTVAVTRTYHMKVCNPDKKEVWQSGKSFGSTNNYLELADQGDRTDTQRTYLPHPAVIVNTDNSDSKGLIVVNNNEGMKSFSRLKVFKDAYIECLQWNGINFETKWQTEKVSKLIGGFDLGDVDHDGRIDLVYAVVSQTGLTLGRKGQSKIVIQHFGK